MERKSVKFPEFNQKTDNWDNYVERLKFCFEANGIEQDNVKKANFFTVCGAQVFETLLALITPHKASDITFSQVEAVLTKHYSPRPNEISMSYQFYKRNQKHGESVAEYIAQLRKLSSGCNFVDLERMLRDRLVCGISDERLQYELLSRDNLSYQSVVDALVSSESAGKDIKMIREQNSSTNLNSASQPCSTTGEPMDVNAIQHKFRKRLCYRCGDWHAGECRFLNSICNYCHKKGHIEKICTLKKKSNKKINLVSNDNYDLNGIYLADGLSHVPPYEVILKLQGVPIQFQIDTGASFSIINEETWEILRSRMSERSLQNCTLTLRTWTESPLKILGQILVKVEYEGIIQKLETMVARGKGPNLLGRNWLKPLNISLNINFLSNIEEISAITKKYSEVFKEGLGKYTGHPVTIYLKPGATPKFLKARPVPYAIKSKVEKEIDRLVHEGVLRSTAFSEWATPVVPIVKKSGEIRLCGDYRSTVNEATESDTYPMPTANEVFAIIAGGKYFTTLDLDRAYTQVVVSDDTAKLLTLNTCKGLYTVHRLAFGVKASPGIFQRLMTSLVAGITGVAVLIDDIIISGSTRSEMHQRLDTVLERINRAGLRLNMNKCKFAKERVEFLGFVIDVDGIHPAPSKVESIMKTPPPKNKQELQAFLGLYNFYERFIPKKATILEPLHRLLDKNVPWHWTEQERNAFNTAKRLITCDLTLVHYDVHKPLVLTCDSSEYGVGAVLSHITDNGQEHPIAMGSRTLNSAERRYSQFDKEATAIMFGIHKFHNYLMGRFFTIITDHKPLLGIFDPKKPISNMLSPRLTRIAIALSSHNYQVVYKPGPDIGNADALSRWPQPVMEKTQECFGEILLMAETPNDFPVEIQQIARETLKDKTLCQVLGYLQRGWPNRVNDISLRPYWLQRDKLSSQEDCILLGCRVIIPTSLRSQILKMLHRTHAGIVHTKELARSYIWWPGLNEDITSLVSTCENCLENRNMPPKTNHEWITPARPWSRLHIDFAGPFHNKTFLIIVDAYSKWPEVFVINNMSSTSVIYYLRLIFATHGLCETLVSDNGRPFVSNELKQFLAANKIVHKTTAPYHPSSNGLAERMVQTVKDKLRKMDKIPWDVKIPNMLLGLRVTPCASTGKSPAELLMNRRLRTVLDTIHPDNLKNRKVEIQITENAQRKSRETNAGQQIMYRNYSSGPKWLPGTVIVKSGPSHYKIKTDDDTIINRHIDQLIKVRGKENRSMEESKEEEVAIQTSREDENIELTEGVTENAQDIIEIPSSDQWTDMLGIPRNEESSSSGGKIKNKLNFHSKRPYDKEVHYLF